MEDGAQAGHQGTDDSKRHAGEHCFDGAGNVEAHYQFELGDRRDEIALVNAAGLVVDIQHAAANHDGDVHGQRDGTGEQVFHVFDKGVELDNLEGDCFNNAILDYRGVERVDKQLHLGLDAVAHELIGVIYDEAQARRVAGVYAARKLRGNDDGGVYFASANIFAGRVLVSVVDGGESSDVDSNGGEGFANFDRLRAMVVIHHSDTRAANFPSESVAQDNELHQGQHHGHDHEDRRTEEFAHFSFDDGKHS